jgi:hypothetical protein
VVSLIAAQTRRIPAIFTPISTRAEAICAESSICLTARRILFEVILHIEGTTKKYQTLILASDRGQSGAGNHRRIFNKCAAGQPNRSYPGILSALSEREVVGGMRAVSL